MLVDNIPLLIINLEKTADTHCHALLLFSCIPFILCCNHFGGKNENGISSIFVTLLQLPRVIGASKIE